MAKPGSKPIPPAIRDAKGTSRADRHGTKTGSLAAQPPIGDPPAHLDDVARGFWVEVAAILKGMGLGILPDRWDLESAALLYSKALEAEAMRPPGGMYIDKFGNPKRHPTDLVSLQCRKELRIALESMGVSAPGRARLFGSAAPAREEPDPGEKFFDGPRKVD